MPSRTHNCGELNKTHINSSVRLCGWVNSLRIHGKIIFIDIRDRYGKTQIILDKKDLINKGNSLSNEDVISICGKVNARTKDFINKNISTGEIEVIADKLHILSISNPLPVPIHDREASTEEHRLKYRYLELRNKTLQDNLIKRHNAAQVVRNFLSKKDFIEIFKIMNGLPVTIRLLDPPLHEFLPKNEKEINDVSKALNLSNKEINSRIGELHEHNPMLGHRGCRLGISFPEIYEMQCRAIFESLVYCKKNKYRSITPEIMIPLVSTEAEIKIMKNLVNRIAEKIQNENNIKIDYLVGTMIELPRAAIKAGEIAKHADFFSFGTNDLTQTTFGISRDDSGKFLNDYIENKIFDVDPFISIDEVVGEFIEIASKKGKKQNKKIKLGICGEHGGDPKSIYFCSKIGLDYVSCSPYRVPVARLAAAQAQLTK